MQGVTEDKGLSIRAYARHRKVSDTAVHKAIKSGRITLEPDGKINQKRADLAWERNTDTTRQPEPAALHATPRAGARDTVAIKDAADPVTPPLTAGGTSLLQARTVNEVVKAQTNKVRLAVLKGDLVDRSQAIAHVFRLARTERDAWLNWPARISAEMAARLEVDAHTLHVAIDSAVREHLMELGELRPQVT